MGCIQFINEADIKNNIKKLLNKMKNNNTALEAANAFRLLIKSYDKEAKKLTKEEAKKKLKRLDKSLMNLYNNYCLSVHAFKFLDNMIFDRLVKINLN